MAVNIYDQVDVGQLECHFKWFNELNNASNGQWLSQLLNKKLHYDLWSNVGGSTVDTSEEYIAVEDLHDKAVDEVIQSTLNQNSLALLSWRCTLILRNTFEKNYDEAFRITVELLNLEEATNPSQSQVHVDTFAYVMLANQFNILKEWRSSGECTVDENEVVKIATRIESLKSNAEITEAKAFMYAMKSNLSRDIQDTHLRVDFAKKATELNPLCACWHRNLYSALRSVRRLRDSLQQPSQLEIDACETAYELESSGDAENVPIGNAVQMAKLQSELLFSCRRGSKEHKQISERAFKFARAALRLKSNSKTLKMRLVSLLTARRTYRQYPTEGFDEAQELVRECEVGPCSSGICHSIGKFYGNPHFVGHDSAKALEWYEKGLEAHICNYPCFADMVRNADFRQKPTAEIVQKIDTMLSFISNRSFKCQLMFIKGFFLWSDDPEGTLRLWLTAMEEAADLEVNFVALATNNYCYIKDGTRDKALAMINNVKFFMSRRGDSDDPIFAKLKTIFNSVFKHFQQLRAPQGNGIARNSPQQRNNVFNRNWRN